MNFTTTWRGLGLEIGTVNATWNALDANLPNEADDALMKSWRLICDECSTASLVSALQWRRRMFDLIRFQPVQQGTIRWRFCKHTISEVSVKCLGHRCRAFCLTLVAYPFLLYVFGRPVNAQYSWHICSQLLPAPGLCRGRNTAAEPSIWHLQTWWSAWHLGESQNKVYSTVTITGDAGTCILDTASTTKCHLTELILHGRTNHIQSQHNFCVHTLGTAGYNVDATRRQAGTAGYDVDATGHSLCKNIRNN